MKVKKLISEHEAVISLAGSVSNDFNNILMAIKGHASLVLKDLAPSHPHHRHLVDIMTIINKGSEITEQLLGFAGEEHPHFETTDLNGIVMRSLKEMSISNRGITVETDFASEPLMADVDPYQIFQVLINILDNAEKAMAHDGVLSVVTEASYIHNGAADDLGMESGRFVKITISDTGIGMDGDTLQHIFDPFYSKRDNSPESGTGLGLAESQGIIKRHGGVIDVWSRPGHGTSVALILPLVEVPVAIDGDEPEMLMGFETILLVDGEEVLLDVGRDVLEDLGYSVTTAVSGEEALEVYQSSGDEIDLVVLDLVMPGINGYETFRLLQEIDPHVKVLVATGYPSRKSVQDMLEAGCRGVIIKPYDIVDFSHQLRNVLEY